jgi:hypothetical protein
LSRRPPLYGAAQSDRVDVSTNIQLRVRRDNRIKGNVCLWHKADIADAVSHVRFWG